MPGKNVVRQDVVQIGFEVKNNPLEDLIDEANKLKKSIGAVDDKSLQELADGAKDAKKSVNKTNEAAKELKNSLKDAATTSFASLKSGLTSVAKTAATVYASVAAIGAGVVAASTKVIGEYADYEQLVGGVDTLFKDSSAKVQKYAEEAYKTSGLSANEYMETVTSFSASLIAGLGGDTEKASEYAQTAIVDMSDNANKMGTDMESIQNAYQGFAKQNYMMLDNLKLGYGGTKEEMERLLKDATKLSGVEYDISNYSDIIAAIHEIQVNMGIAGTTAEEAEETITGSISMMKSAFKNLLAGMGNADADMDKLTDNVISSFETVATNIMPIVENAIEHLPETINAFLTTGFDIIRQSAPQLKEAIMSIIRTVIPEAIRGLYEIITGEPMPDDVFNVLKDALEEVISVIREVGEVFSKIIKAVVKFGAKNIGTLTKLILALVIAVKAYNVVMQVGGKWLKVWNNIQKLKTALTKADTAATVTQTIAQKALNAAIAAMPYVAAVAAVAALGYGLVKLRDAVSPLNKKLKENSDNITATMKSVTTFKEAMDATEPTLANFDSLLSSQGRNLTAIDDEIASVETAITTILGTALSEQQALREEDITNIKAYQEQLSQLYSEKLGVYSSQLGAIELQASLGLEGGFNQEEAAQIVTNAKEALSSGLDALTGVYQQKLTNLQNEYSAGMYTESQYASELQKIYQWQEEQKSVFNETYAEIMRIVSDSAMQIGDSTTQIYDDLARQGFAFDNADQMVSWSERVAGSGPYLQRANDALATYTDDLNSLTPEVVEASSALLNAYAMIKESGGEVDPVMEQQVQSILSAFSNVPEQMQGDAKNVVLGLVAGLEESVPDLQNASEMTAEEISNTVRQALGIHSPSTVMYGFGVNTIQGLQDGIISKRASLMRTVQSIASAVKTTLQTALEIHSPSRFTEWVGENLGLGAISGIDKSIPRVEAAASTLSTALASPISGISAGTSTTNNTSTSHIENNTYAPSFNLTVSGTSDDRSTARKVKEWVKEAMDETFDSMGRKGATAVVY